MMNEKPLSIKEVMQYAKSDYGEIYHYNTVLGWLLKGKLKGFKRGGQWRVYRDIVDAFFCPKTENKPSKIGEKAA
jgi:hypothetical protein